MQNITLNEFNRSTRTIIKVTVKRGNATRKEYTFFDSFKIGRAEECSIQLNEGGVSRIHVEVKLLNGRWWIIDNNSRNGTYLNGGRINKAEIINPVTIELGSNGPSLIFSPEEKAGGKREEEKQAKTFTPVSNAPQNDPSKKNDPSLTGYIKYYFDESKESDQIGPHTRMVREAFKVVKKRHSSRYIIIIAALAVIALSGLGYSIYQHLKENRQKLMAESIFYEMKTLELEISTLKNQFKSSADPKIVNALEKFDEKHKQLENSYNSLLDELDVYDLKAEDKAIIKISRIFGECEFGIPGEFTEKVKNYINKWRSSSRLVNAIERAKQKGFIQIVANSLMENQLPPQFLYLALQESDFKEQIVGPMTRHGYAKGIWQFIAETAEKYGLRIGPLAQQNVFDPGDDRFNFEKATNAAAKYLKDIYNTDAQASGLLVMASYNWGEQNIVPLIRSMPENPRERNFWRLLEKYRDKIPAETYNYVFYIISAAVICENPRLFGFNFDNPLKDIPQKNLLQKNLPQSINK